MSSGGASEALPTAYTAVVSEVHFYSMESRGARAASIIQVNDIQG